MKEATKKGTCPECLGDGLVEHCKDVWNWRTDCHDTEDWVEECDACDGKGAVDAE